MNFFAPISVFRSHKDNRGMVMPLAEFMRMGAERYADVITHYRNLKKVYVESSAKLDALQLQVEELSEATAGQENPLGGEDSAAIAEQKTRLQSVLAEADKLATEIGDYKKRLSQMKVDLPGATLAGYFAPTRAKANLQQHSGFLCIDIDDHYELNGKTYRQSLSDIESLLDSVPFVCYASHSIGGIGYFALVPIGKVDSQHPHEWYFDCLKAEFEQMGIVIDPACRDTTRMRCVSFDEHPIRNKFAQPYLGSMRFESRNDRIRSQLEERRKAERFARVSLKDANDDLRRICSCVAQIERCHINLAEDYSTWIEIGYALSTSFGEQGRQLYHAISRQSSKYTEKETDRNYSYMLRSSRGSVTVASLFALFKANGVRWQKEY